MDTLGGRQKPAVAWSRAALMSSKAEPIAPNPQATALELATGAEAVLDTLGESGEPAGLDALHTLVATSPDLGGTLAGQVAAGLLQLLDDLIAGGRFDREALSVHVRAWRLMLTTAPDPEAGAVLIAGLNSIRSLYAAQAKAA